MTGLKVCRAPRVGLACPTSQGKRAGKGQRARLQGERATPAPIRTGHAAVRRMRLGWLMGKFGVLMGAMPEQHVVWLVQS